MSLLISLRCSSTFLYQWYHVTSWILGNDLQCTKIMHPRTIGITPPHKNCTVSKTSLLSHRGTKPTMNTIIYKGRRIRLKINIGFPNVCRLAYMQINTDTMECKRQSKSSIYSIPCTNSLKSQLNRSAEPIFGLI